MSNTILNELSADEWDEQNFPRAEENEFDRVVERAISRRGFLGGALAFGSGAAVMGTGILGLTASEAKASVSRFAFTPIPTHTDSTVHVPEGYNWKILTSWGDPLIEGAEAFNDETGGSAASSDKVFGENTDGMENFVYQGKQLLAINHEFATRKLNLPLNEEGIPKSAEDVLKLQNLQGASVIEVEDSENGWQIVKGSRFNRRITHNTPMKLAGPAVGHPLMQTAADPAGVQSLGTFNNCGSGKTPWGTYLTCEENFNGYFGETDAAPVARLDGVDAGYKRYGLSKDGWGYEYHKFDERFDTAKNPNEPHRMGWIVEIDPTDPTSTPVKHTALGRFKHENAEAVLAPDRRVVVYMGDDERGEFMYRFVSNGVYTPGQSTDGLLDDGILYVAKFNDDLTGEWLPLTPQSTGMDAAEILIFSRLAGSAVGATTMDRPEWISTNPNEVEAYCCLTNNKNRGVKPNAGGDDTSVNGPNPRETNNYGQIVRWRPHNEDHASDTFDWDLYVMAGNPTVHDGPNAGSDNIHAGNMFNSPDGMAFDENGLVWIQTDGNDSNEGDFAGMGNNQMLVGDPVSGEIARFMTGPNGCEVTGLTWSADRRSMFVGIQHPGGNWPDGGKLPRSSVIVIKRDDDGVIG
ncbi:hypothetical protein PsAD2_00077 [Pseudovibrio axinellae]|uniref:Phosphatase n=1 Tax=Pseudovibrio axinellae TaxID=989403 RepID=A0A166B9U6_9HYPH|nr:PhoX family phosphatase [Pseudovibrio axinellae]KZL22052.1 hypothetical protein PsAD2_00077 [Pseudovibrio axinellae]SEQ57101.1 hypothetical protein SAMN05421798_103123 [Pseudovibrio axinellae]